MWKPLSSIAKTQKRIENICKKLITLEVRGDIIRFPEDDKDLFAKDEKINPREKQEYREHRKQLKIRSLAQRTHSKQPTRSM